ncbi:MAG: RNA 2',3'-cyclic phosphodiesterase [Deltaproteobacteria bacterium]|nr:RNA 2',3'-cyclic phosphodiesterase [Deltaproteobacteria bacterium]
MSKLHTIRTFLAVNVSIETTRKITAFQDQLKEFFRAETDRVSWVPSANIHQTIRFFGDVDPELTEAVEAAMGRASKSIASFSVRAVGLDAFPNAQHPRVLWVGLRDEDGGLEMLFSAVEVELEQVGFARDSRGLSPHLTIGRVRHSDRDISDLVELNSDKDFGVSRVEECVLYESVLHRKGAEYRVLFRVPLIATPSSDAPLTGLRSD